MNKTAIYIRVSTEMQVEDGYSISAQKQVLTDYCNIKSWNIAGYYIDEGISGKSLERPEIQKLISDIKENKINNVLVYKIDRITRSTRDLINLVELFQKYNCEFNSLTENIDTSSPAGRGMLKMLAVFAEMERENISQRCSLAQQEKARQGKILNYNNPPIGYKWNLETKTYDIIEDDSDCIKLIFDKFSKGESYYAIAKYLNANNIGTKRNWYRGMIKNIISNCLYIGKVRYGYTKKNSNYFEAQGSHPKIIDEDIFYRCQKIAKEKTTQIVRKYPKEYATFGSHIYCAKCGKRAFPRTTYTTFHGKKYYGASYTCSSVRHGLCDALSISNQALQKEFIKCVGNQQLNGAAIINNNESQIKEINKLIDNLNMQNDRMKKLYIKELITLEEYEDFRNDNIAQIEAHKTTIQSLSVNILGKEKTHQIELISHDIKENFQSLSMIDKRKFIDEFIFKIYVVKENKIVKIKSISFI